MAITSNVQIDRSAFAEELASDAHQMGSPAFIQSLLEQAKAKIAGGGGELAFLTSGSENSKNAMQESRMDAVELFTLAGQAFTLYLGKVARGISPEAMLPVSCSYADFSCLS